MRTLFKSLVAIACFGFVAQASAQTTIDELIEQTGVEPGEIAMRDMPSWRTPKKIIMREFGIPVAEIREMMPAVEVVTARSESEALVHASTADAIIGWCSERLIAAAPNATWAQIGSAGAEGCMSTQRIMSGDVVLTNMQKMSSPMIAEHAIAMTMSLFRQLPFFTKGMARGKWLRGAQEVGQMQSVVGKTMLVAGLGGIGTEVARRAAALDMRVIGTRRSSREGPEFVEYVGLSDELVTLAGEADVIVIALPLTPETEGLIDKEFFAAAKKGVFLINVGRGKIVDTDDLVDALKSGQVAGAGLDVTEPEPLPWNHALWKQSNVLITPHISSRGFSRERQAILLKENLRRFVAGDALLNVVDPELGY